MSNAERLREFYDVVWNGADTAAIPRFVSPNFAVAGMVDDMGLGVQDMEVLVRSTHALMAGARFALPRVIDAGDDVAALVVMTGRSVHTGAAVRMQGQVMVRFEDGLIAESDNTFDLLGLAVQTGLLPPDAVLRLMSGAPLAA